MKNIFTFVFLLTISNLTYAVGNANIPLQGGTVPPFRTFRLDLSTLYPLEPYQVTCIMNNNAYMKDAPDINVTVSQPPVNQPPIIYYLNGTSFQNAAALKKLNNTFVAKYVENDGAYPTALQIYNLDTKHSFTISNCVATPIVGSSSQ